MRCTAKSNSTGEQCRQNAMVGKSVCQKHGGMGGRPTDLVRNAPPELRPVLKRLKPDIQEAVATAKLIKSTELLRENAAVAQALADEFTVNSTAYSLSADVVGTVIEHYKGVSDLQNTIAKMEYAEQHLIKKTDVIAILYAMSGRCDKAIRSAVGRLYEISDSDRERLEKRLRDSIAEVMAGVINEAMSVKSK